MYASHVKGSRGNLKQLGRTRGPVPFRLSQNLTSNQRLSSEKPAIWLLCERGVFDFRGIDGCHYQLLLVYARYLLCWHNHSVLKNRAETYSSANSQPERLVEVRSMPGVLYRPVTHG